MSEINANYEKSMKLKDFSLLTDEELVVLLEQYKKRYYFNKSMNPEPLRSCMEIFNDDVRFHISMSSDALSRFEKIIKNRGTL